MTIRFPTFAAPVITAALLLTACADAQPRPASPPASTSAAAPPPAATTASPPPSSSPAAPAPAPVTAVDGTNLAACADGACSVEIRVGNLIRFSGPVGARLASLRVVSVSADGVQFEVPSGALIGGNGVLTLNDAVTVTFGTITGGRALIRIEPAAGPSA